MYKYKDGDDLKKKLGSRVGSLCKNDPNIESLNIKSSTLDKYKGGRHFPAPDFLVKIKNHYDVSFSYLFGETDNKDFNSEEISYKLGLTSRATHKLIAMNDNDDQEERELQLFALNQLIENVDFLKLVELMLGYNGNDEGYNDYLINKRLFELLKKIRNSKEYHNLMKERDEK